MPEHIHTIPVTEALQEPKGCAFCVMHEKLTRDAVQFIMGPAYMEDDVRMETNKVGFCKTHLAAMYEAQNRLGLGLMLHTYMQRLNKDACDIINGRIRAPLFGKDKSGTTARLKNHLQKTNESCYVCKKVEDTFTRYIDTFFYIWGKGGDDAKLIESQKGFCVPHFIRLLEFLENAGRGRREKFLDILLPMQQNKFEEIENDLDWFVQKFDHRNADEPWKNSKDALPRAINLLGGCGSVINSRLNPKPDDYLYIAWDGVNADRLQLENLAHALSVIVENPESQAVAITNYSMTENFQVNQALRTRLMALMQVGNVDAYIATGEIINVLYRGGYLRPLCDVVSHLENDVSGRMENLYAVSLEGSPLLAEMEIDSTDIYLSMILNSENIYAMAKVLEVLLYGA
jgi:hypothetical protein